MNNGKKKKFKGMTLVEIIVSLGVFSVMTLVLVRASSAINLYIRSANTVNKTVADQAPIAEIGHTDAANKVADDAAIIVYYDSMASSVAVGGDAYQVKDGGTLSENQIGGQLNMQFIILDEIETPEEDE